MLAYVEYVRSFQCEHYTYIDTFSFIDVVHPCGIFGLLPNVAWTNEGAIAIEDLTQRQMDARLRGESLHVNAVDKFPRMTDYAVPKGIRIGDASRVRLGAHVAEGTTVMHEGFINFNAGTLGHGMIEGRISAGVTVGHNSDLGGEIGRAHV